MHITLWKGDDNASLVKLVVDCTMQFTYGRYPVIQVVYEHTGGQCQGVIAKTIKSYNGTGSSMILSFSLAASCISFIASGTSLP